MSINPAGGQAFTVGNTILVFDPDDATSDLLGHEGVHGVQSNAAGGAANFLNNYNKASEAAGNNPYYGNEYEKAAYSFGPENSDADTKLPDGKSFVTVTW